MDTPPITVVCFRWKTPGYRSTFGPETVWTLRRMVLRHYPHRHRFVCLSDDPSGLEGIEVHPMWTDYADLPAPTGPRNPACYRRLRLFHPDIEAELGPRIVSLDLDCVITGDLTPVWNRPEDFVIYGDTNPTTFYNGSMILLTAGARPKVWTEFDPVRSPRDAQAAGHFGSDQGWISYCLGPSEKKWGLDDGVYSYRNHLSQTDQLPPTARLVAFHGRTKPWDHQAQALPWVRLHYR